LDGDCNDANENIKYTITGNDITRQVPGEDPEELTDGNANDTGLILTYFDQAGVELTSTPLDATDRDAIHRVQITVKIDSKHKAAKFGGDITAEMTTNVVLRNPA
jgi:hypothetical protein